MSKDHVDECQRDIADMKKLLYGDPATGRGGLAHVVDTMGTTLYGTDKIPGGVVADVSTLKKYFWMAIGAVTAIQVVVEIAFKLWSK